MTSMHPLFAISMSLNEIIAIAVLGIVAGALARFLIPGKQSMNIIFTMVLGIVGAFVGGFIKDQTGLGGDSLPWTLGWATAGASVVLMIVMAIQRVAGK